MSICTRIILVFFYFVFLFYGLFYIVWSLHNFEPNKSYKNPCLFEKTYSLLWRGVAILIFAVIGMVISTCFKVKTLQSIYFWVLVFTTITTIIFSIFVSVGMPRRSALDTYNKTYSNGFWLKEYKPALQAFLVEGEDWKEYSTCFKETKTCQVMANETDDQKSNYIEKGCCRPPNRCGLQQASSGLWLAPPDDGLASNDDECKMWAKSGQDCFDCDSCKAGYLANYQDLWDKEIGFRIARIVVLILVTSVLTYYTVVDDHRKSKNPNKHSRPVQHV